MAITFKSSTEKKNIVCTNDAIKNHNRAEAGGCVPCPPPFPTPCPLYPLASYKSTNWQKLTENDSERIIFRIFLRWTQQHSKSRPPLLKSSTRGCKKWSLAMNYISIYPIYVADSIFYEFHNIYWAYLFSLNWLRTWLQKVEIKESSYVLNISFDCNCFDWICVFMLWEENSCLE